MALPIITRANQSIEAQTPATVQYSTGPAQALKYLGDSLVQVSQDIQQKAKQKYAADVDVTIKSEVARIERENLGDPDKMMQAMQTWRQGYVPKLEGTDMQDFAGQTFDLGIIGPINRAYATQGARIDTETQRSLFMQIEANQQSIANNIDDLFSSDKKVSQAAWNNIAHSSMIIDKAAGTVGLDGLPLLSGQAGANLVIDTKDKLMSSIALKWLAGQTDAYAAYDALKSGTAVFEVQDGEKAYKLNLMESLTSEARKQVLNESERYITMQNSMQKQASSDYAAMVSLLVSRGEYGYKDLDKDLKSGKIDVEKYVQLSKELDSKFKTDTDSAVNYGIIADRLAGKPGVIDLENPQMKKDIEGYFEKVIMTAVDGKDDNIRINAIVDYVKTVGVVPKQLIGGMKSAFRTGTADQIRAYADIVGQIKEHNPAIFNDFPKEEVAFGEVVADMVNAGEKPEEAVKIAKELVNPANRAVVQERTDKIKTRKKEDYQKEVRGVFDSWIPFAGVKIDPNTQAGAAVVADYKTEYDAYYKMTGNENVSRQHALAVVKGVYGVTEFNGKAVMAHPPEKYYSVQGLENQNWMVQQLMDDVRAEGTIPGVEIKPGSRTPQTGEMQTLPGIQGAMMLKNIESIGAVFNQSDPLEERLRLVSDNTTERMAATGKPGYLVYFINDAGAPVPVLNKQGHPVRWAPTVERGKKTAITEARKAAQKDETMQFQRKAQYGY